MRCMYLCTLVSVLSSPVHLVFGYQPAPAQNPTGDVKQFVTEFEREFGPAHPPILTCNYSQLRGRGMRVAGMGAWWGGQLGGGGERLS